MIRMICPITPLILLLPVKYIKPEIPSMLSGAPFVIRRHPSLVQATTDTRLRIKLKGISSIFVYVLRSFRGDTDSNCCVHRALQTCLEVRVHRSQIKDVPGRLAFCVCIRIQIQFPLGECAGLVCTEDVHVG